MADTRDEKDFELNPWSNRAVDPVVPNRPFDRIKEQENTVPPTLEALRLRNWEIQKKLQSGHIWDREFKLRFINENVETANGVLESCGAGCMVRIEQERPHFRLKLVRKDGGTAAVSPYYKFSALKADNIESIVYNFLKSNNLIEI